MYMSLECRATSRAVYWKHNMFAWHQQNGDSGTSYQEACRRPLR